VLSARINNRRREFEIELSDRGVLSFPYRLAEPPPTREDPVRDCYVDPELGGDGVTFVLRSGAEGSVLADHVRELHRDPSYMRDLLLYQLSAEAQERFSASAMGVRELARRLGTSPAQVYRLLDPTNYTKTIDRMLELLQILDAKVELKVT
jgi:hypothetical protein